jgi:hypothetical protein
LVSEFWPDQRIIALGRDLLAGLDPTLPGLEGLANKKGSFLDQHLSFTFQSELH